MSSSNYRKKSRRSDHDVRTSRRSKSADPPQVSLPGDGRSKMNPSSSKVSRTESSGDSNNEKLLVALRIRPLKNEEISRGYESVATKIDSKVRNEMSFTYHNIKYFVQMVLLASTKAKKVDHLRERRNNERQYVFDVVFGADSSQEEVYTSTTKHLVDNVMAGYNATVFAYGATGGGKTYTMVGTRDNPGIMVRALNDLFEAAGESNRKVR